MPVIEDRAIRDKIASHDRQLLKLTDKLMRQTFLFDNELLRSNPLPDPPPEPTKGRWGLLAGAAGQPDQLWLWAKRSTDLWSWNGPFNVMS